MNENLHFAVGKRFNEETQKWEIAVQVAGFETEANADSAATQIAEWMGETGKVERVQ